MKVYLGIVSAVFAIATLAETEAEKSKVFGKCFCLSTLLMTAINLIS